MKKNIQCTSCHDCVSREVCSLKDSYLTNANIISENILDTSKVVISCNYYNKAINYRALTPVEKDLKERMGC